MDSELQLTTEEALAFATHYDQTPPTSDEGDWTRFPCWPWNRKPPHQHKKNERGGYGHFKGKGAHRVMWVLVNGPLPADPKKVGHSKVAKLEVCHRCDVRNCVQPAHLFVGDHQANHGDAAAKGRKVSPGTGGTKLTAEIVIAMRLAVQAGASRESQARKYGVVVSTAFKAIAGTGPHGTWKHVPYAQGWTDGPYQEVLEGGFLVWPEEKECPESK